MGMAGECFLGMMCCRRFDLYTGLLNPIERGINTGLYRDHIYDLSYFFGFLVSLTVHCTLHRVFPARKQTGASPFVMELHRTSYDELSRQHHPESHCKLGKQVADIGVDATNTLE